MPAQAGQSVARIDCPVCGRNVSVTSGGYMRVHRRECVAADGPVVECRGSGWSAALIKEVLARDPMTTRWGQIGGILW